MLLFIAAVAGTLVVNILARVSGFAKNINKARRDLRGFEKQTKATATKAATLSSALGKLGLSLGGIFSARAAIGFLKTLALQIDLLGKVSGRLGIATEELGFLQFAADKAGIATNTLNIGIQRMIRRVGEAAQGFGEAKNAIKDLGFDATELVKLDPAAQFLAIGKAITQITNQNEKIAKTFKLFDSEGVALLQLLESDIGASRRAWTEFSLALKGTDVKTIEELVTSVTTLRDALKGFGQQFLIDVSPEALETIRGALVLVSAAAQARKVAKEFDTKTSGIRKLLTGPGIGFNVAREVSKKFSQTFEGAIAGDIATPQIPFAKPSELGLRKSLRRTQRLEDVRQQVIAERPELGGGPRTQPDEDIVAWLKKIALNTERAAEAAAGNNF